MIKVYLKRSRLSIFIIWKAMATMSQSIAWEFNEFDDALINIALREDLNFPYLDITSKTLFGQKNHQIQTQIMSKHPEPFVLSGIKIPRFILNKMDAAITLNTYFNDGEKEAT